MSNTVETPAAELRVLNKILVVSLFASGILKLLSIFMMITTGSRLLILGFVAVAMYSLLLLGTMGYKRWAYIIAMFYLAQSASAYFSPGVVYNLDPSSGLMNVVTVAVLVFGVVLSGILAVRTTSEPSPEAQLR